MRNEECPPALPENGRLGRNSKLNGEKSICKIQNRWIVARSSDFVNNAG